jgi:hypothetical protein
MPGPRVSKSKADAVRLLGELEKFAAWAELELARLR